MCIICTCIQKYRTYHFHDLHVTDANCYMDINYSVPQMVLIVRNILQSVVTNL
jgi:hypothetical protein